MALANYSDLLTQVDTETRDSLQTLTPNWIILVEQDLKRRLRVREMVTRATASTTAASAYLELPTGFLSMRALHLNTDPVTDIEIVDIDRLSRNYTTSNGKPLQAAIFGTELKFDRPADSAYTAEMIYYKYPDGLTVSNTTNTIMTNYPHLYLWGVCVIASKYLREDAAERRYQVLYEQYLDQVNREAIEARYGSTIRMMGDVSPP